MNVVDLVLEDPGHLDRVRAAEPRVAGIQVDPQRLGISEHFEDVPESLDRVGDRPVRLQQNANSVVFRHANGAVELLGDDEDALVVGEVFGPLRPRLQLGRDHVLDPDGRREPDGFHDLGRAEYPGIAGLEQGGMGANRGRRDPVLLEQPPHLERVLVQADGRGEPRRSEQAAAGVHVGNVGIRESHRAGALQLPLDTCERLYQKKHSNVHRRCFLVVACLR